MVAIRSGFDGQRARERAAAIVNKWRQFFSETTDRAGQSATINSVDIILRMTSLSNAYGGMLEADGFADRVQQLLRRGVLVQGSLGVAFRCYGAYIEFDNNDPVISGFHP